MISIAKNHIAKTCWCKVCKDLPLPHAKDFRTVNQWTVSNNKIAHHSNQRTLLNQWTIAHQSKSQLILGQ